MGRGKASLDSKHILFSSRLPEKKSFWPKILTQDITDDRWTMFRYHLWELSDLELDKIIQAGRAGRLYESESFKKLYTWVKSENDFDWAEAGSSLKEKVELSKLEKAIFAKQFLDKLEDLKITRAEKNSESKKENSFSILSLHPSLSLFIDQVKIDPVFIPNISRHDFDKLSTNHLLFEQIGDYLKENPTKTPNMNTSELLLEIIKNINFEYYQNKIARETEFFSKCFSQSPKSKAPGATVSEIKLRYNLTESEFYMLVLNNFYKDLKENPKDLKEKTLFQIFSGSKNAAFKDVYRTTFFELAFYTEAYYPGDRKRREESEKELIKKTFAEAPSPEVSRRYALRRLAPVVARSRNYEVFEKLLLSEDLEKLSVDSFHESLRIFYNLMLFSDDTNTQKRLDTIIHDWSQILIPREIERVKK